jgi:glycosyltransferase involved in cell wall biosynthesis
LSRKHDVSLISFGTADQAQAADTLTELCRHVVVVPYRPHALLPRLWRLWWRTWLPRVYGRNVSVAYWRSLKSLLAANAFDVVIVDGMMAVYGRFIGQTPKVLDEVDIYASVAYQTFKNESRPIQRLLNWLDWLQTRAMELRCARAHDGLLVRSANDRRVMVEKLPGQPIAILMPWFEGLTELQSIPARRPSGNTLLFMGAMNHPKNVEAVTYFADQVLPLVREQVPDATLYIVGSAPTQRVLALGRRPEITVTGAVPSLTPYYERCAVNVVPMLTGGGVIVKALNGLAAARPTVTTRFGNAGIGARDGHDILVAAGGGPEFAAAVIRLLDDQVTWQTLAENGRQFVRQNYDWQRNMEALDDFLTRVV